MKSVFDNTFFRGSLCVCVCVFVCVCVCGGVKLCSHNVKRGGYLMMMLDYKRGSEGQESEKK